MRMGAVFCFCAGWCGLLLAHSPSVSFADSSLREGAGFVRGLKSTERRLRENAGAALLFRSKKKALPLFTIPCYNIPITHKEDIPMKASTQRIWAIIGLFLIFTSIVLMLVGFFTGAAAGLLTNISLFCFVGAVAVLMFLSFKRKQAETKKSDDDA